MKKKDGGLVLQPPPFFGSWENPIGMGVKKKSSQKRKRTSIGQKQSIQWDSHIRGNIINFVEQKQQSPTIKFINKPLSNYDLMSWVNKLGIKHFRGIKSRDTLPKRMKKDECGIINLDTHIGPGTQWVAYRNGDK